MISAAWPFLSLSTMASKNNTNAAKILSALKAGSDYSLSTDKGGLSARLANQCGKDRKGADLIYGVTQDGLNLLAARLVLAAIAADSELAEHDLADLFKAFSLTNASAFRQGLEKCSIAVDGLAAMDLKDVWGGTNSSPAAANLGRWLDL